METIILTKGDLDFFFARCWHRVLRPLCNLAGKSNFFFARGAAIIGWTICLADLALSTTSVPWPLATIAVVSFLWWAFYFHIHWADIRQVEGLASRMSDETVGFTIMEISTLMRLFMVRQVWTVIGLLLILLMALPPNSTISWFGLSQIFLSASAYFTTIIRPPGKSVWAKAKEKVKAKIEALSWRPVPIPIPTS